MIGRKNDKKTCQCENIWVKNIFIFDLIFSCDIFKFCLSVRLKKVRLIFHCELEYFLCVKIILIRFLKIIYFFCNWNSILIVWIKILVGCVFLKSFVLWFTHNRIAFFRIYKPLYKIASLETWKFLSLMILFWNFWNVMNLFYKKFIGNLNKKKF